MMEEATIHDAPVHLSSEEAWAWVHGYNACREVLVSGTGSPKDHDRRRLDNLDAWVHKVLLLRKAQEIPPYTRSLSLVMDNVVPRMQEHPDATRRTLNLRIYPYSRTYAWFGSDDDASDRASEGNGPNATATAIILAAREAVESYRK